MAAVGTYRWRASLSSSLALGHLSAFGPESPTAFMVKVILEQIHYLFIIIKLIIITKRTTKDSFAEISVSLAETPKGRDTR